MTTITRYTKKFAHYLRNTRAVSALEYAILVGIVAVSIAAAIGLLGDEVNDVIDKATAKVTAGGTAVTNQNP